MSENISRIFYINLKHRTDRKDEIENELKKMELTNYERFDAYQVDWFGLIGCGFSHQGVLKLAKERNYENVLILEDDFQFLVSKEELEENLRSFFSLNIDYEVCMLSYNLIEKDNESLPQYEILHKIKDAQTASGYLVHKSMYDPLIELLEWAMHELHNTQQHWIYANDIVWKKFQKSGKWYCFKTRIGKQRPSYSDNGKNFTDYGC